MAPADFRVDVMIHGLTQPTALQEIQALERIAHAVQALPRLSRLFNDQMVAWAGLRMRGGQSADIHEEWLKAMEEANTVEPPSTYVHDLERRVLELMHQGEQSTKLIHQQATSMRNQREDAKAQSETIQDLRRRLASATQLIGNPKPDRPREEAIELASFFQGLSADLTEKIERALSILRDKNSDLPNRYRRMLTEVLTNTDPPKAVNQADAIDYPGQPPDFGRPGVTEAINAWEPDQTKAIHRADPPPRQN